MVQEGLLGGDIYPRTRMARKSQPSAALGKELSRQNTQCKGLRPGLSLEGGGMSTATVARGRDAGFMLRAMRGKYLLRDQSANKLE